VVISGTGIELNHASANTLTASGGVLSIEGNVVHHTGGTDIADGDIADDITLSTTKDVTLTLTDPDIIMVDSDNTQTVTMQVNSVEDTNADFTIAADVGDTAAVFFEWDASDEALILGDSGTGEDLKIDFEHATDNTIGISTAGGGTTDLNFGTLNMATTGTIQGAIAVNTDANGMTQGESWYVEPACCCGRDEFLYLLHNGGCDYSEP
jgi:hypothetical protein